MKNQLYRIPALKWTEEKYASAFGDNYAYFVFLDDGVWRWWPHREGSSPAPENTEESARQACEDHFRCKMEALLEPVEFISQGKCFCGEEKSQGWHLGCPGCLSRISMHEKYRLSHYYYRMMELGGNEFEDAYLEQKAKVKALIEALS